MKKAILISYDKEDAINEASALCNAAGYHIVHTLAQGFLSRPKYGISEETVAKLEEIAQKTDPDVIIYDEILKPSQNYNLASKLHRNILDREALILEIFESRASSYESKMQVKLAQMRYEMSRAKEKVRLAKMGEQPGFMGIGKFEVDVYYNDIKNRMHTVKSKLVKSGKQRELHRQGRKRQGFKTISLAGYTSAGKTTLFNKMTGEDRDQSKELFTTLSTTIRRVSINQDTYLMSDTVGFISKLPAYMIEAFRSTLEELLHTEIILLVIDISDPLVELKKKFYSCIKTLNELQVPADKIIFALNKADITDEKDIQKKIEYLDLYANKKYIPISAKTGYNIEELSNLIGNLIQIQNQPNVKKSLDELEGIHGN